MLILNSWLALLLFCFSSHSLASSHALADNHPAMATLSEELVFNSSYSKWSQSIDGLAALMIEMKHHITTDVLKTQNKEESITWCRSTIATLHEWRKTIKKSLSMNTLHHALEPIFTLISSLLRSLEQEIIDLNAVRFSQHTNHSAEKDPSLLQTRIDTSLEQLRRRIQEKSGQLTIINKIARFIEEAILEIDEKTALTTWGPYAPAILGITVRFLPDIVRSWITNHLYGGVLPQWDIQYLGYMPQFRIVGPMGPSGNALPEPLYNRLGRIEKMYSQLIGLYVAYRIWGMYPGFEKLTLSFENFANIIKDKTASFWSSLKGKQYFSKTHKFEIIEGIDLSNENLIGMDEQKKQVTDIINFMVDHEGFIRSGHTVPKGIILTGPPQTGKELFARAMTGTINRKLLEIGEDDLVNFIEPTMESLLGTLYKGDQFIGSQGASDHKNKFAEFINEVKAHAPVIVFINELHMYRLQTSGDTELLARLMTALKDLNTEPESKIIIIAATDRPDLLAKELLTYQCLSKQIRFHLPDAQLRKQFFTLKFIKQLLLDAENLDLDSYVHQTVGCNFGQLEAVVISSKFSANQQTSKNAKCALGHTHIQQAIDREIHRLIPHLSLTQDEQEAVSVHMAGHILVHHLLNPTQKIERATILGYHKPIVEFFAHQKIRDHYNPEEQFAIKYGKIVTYNYSETLNISNLENYEKLAQVALAGHVAEKVIYGSALDNYHEEDAQEAWDYLYKSMGTKVFPCNKAKGLSALCDAVKGTLDERIGSLETKNEELLQNHKDTLLALAKSLQENISLTGKEISSILAKKT